MLEAGTCILSIAIWKLNWFHFNNKRTASVAILRETTMGLLGRVWEQRFSACFCLDSPTLGLDRRDRKRSSYWLFGGLWLTTLSLLPIELKFRGFNRWGASGFSFVAIISCLFLWRLLRGDFLGDFDRFFGLFLSLNYVGYQLFGLRFLRLFWCSFGLI